MSKKRKKGKSSLFNKFMIFFVIIAVASSIFSIYEILLLSSIETLIRYIVIGAIHLLKIQPIENAQIHVGQFIIGAIQFFQSA